MIFLVLGQLLEPRGSRGVANPHRVFCTFKKWNGAYISYAKSQMAKSKNRRHETTRFPVPNGRPSDPKSPKVTPKPLRFPLREEGGIAKWKCMSLTVVY